jgi:sulfur transfer complex TusBCD TusB component (DsrH family)
MKNVVVVVRSASEKNRCAAEALRGAVGLAAGGHRVKVLLCEDGVRAAALPGEVDKALSTLRLLGHEVLVETESLQARNLSALPGYRLVSRDELPAMLAAADAVEAWR